VLTISDPKVPSHDRLVGVVPPWLNWGHSQKQSPGPRRGRFGRS